jgi:hypothetical protein
MAEETRTALIASVKEREKSLKIVLKRIYDQVDVIHLVLNFYESVPEWLKDKQKVVCHLNTENRHAHDSIWSWVPESGYVFCMDDDLMYPQDFCEKLIEALRRHEHKVVCTAHGSNLVLPAGDYTDCKQTWGFSDRLERDIFNDLCGVGVCGFHVLTFEDCQLGLNLFKIPFMRDLYFSLHCAKNNVPIVNIARPSQWILPLATPGSTVYEETLNNERLRALKNRVMKEQLLPSLHCANHDGSGQYVLITDYGFDSRLISKTLRTLDEVSDEETNIVVFSDELKDYSFQKQGAYESADQKSRKVLTQFVTPDERSIGRMGSKVLTQYRFICGLPNGSRVISADGDLYFMRDPFLAFAIDSATKEYRRSDRFDIGVTTRCEPYKYPINGGVVMFRVNDRVKDFLRFLIGQVYELTDPDLISYQKRFGHDKQENPADWYIDQDMWNVAYLGDDRLKEHFGVKITDVGCTFNFAPHADGEQTASGKAKLLRAYHDESVHVLHLKSRLKELLFEGLLP